MTRNILSDFWGVGGARSPSQHFSIFSIGSPTSLLPSAHAKEIRNLISLRGLSINPDSHCNIMLTDLKMGLATRKFLGGCFSELFQRPNIQIIGQHCDANISMKMPLLNLAEIAADSIRIDIRYFGLENFVGTRDSRTHYQFTF